MFSVKSRSNNSETKMTVITETIQCIRKCDSTPWRPLTSDNDDLSARLKLVIQSCWAEWAAERPTINDVKSQVTKILGLGKRRESRLIDEILIRLEVYATNLEDDVAMRTQALILERKKCDDLLGEMLPRSAQIINITGYKMP